jgi:hypothetical protein
MSVFGLLAVVAGAGGVGGVVAALLSDDKGFWYPQKVKEATGVIFRPGFLGLILVGAAAAALSFALYGPLASETVVGGPESVDDAIAQDDGEDFGLTLAALGGAFLVGMGGSKWLSSQVDSKLLKDAASTAAAKDGAEEDAAEIANATPTQALRLAKAM